MRSGSKTGRGNKHTKFTDMFVMPVLQDISPIQATEYFIQSFRVVRKESRPKLDEIDKFFISLLKNMLADIINQLPQDINKMASSTIDQYDIAIEYGAYKAKLATDLLNVLKRAPSLEPIREEYDIIEEYRDNMIEYVDDMQQSIQLNNDAELQQLLGNIRIPNH